MSIVKDVLIGDVKKAIAQTTKYKKLREQAKSKTKQRYYKQKQEKNNNKIIKLLTAIERLNNKST